ncbi:MAG TPA: hypothetical protein VEO19_04635 [Terriglobia bacterium]|nr:hypothetical protein [Terriglobia bacterium]
MKREPKVCPECDHVFKGNGWDGIDAHWRAKHERVIPYNEAWPLIQSGTYKRPTNPTSRKPREDTNQIAYRVMQGVIKRTEKSAI